jgi:lipopolysaccharide transport system permease protein
MLIFTVVFGRIAKLPSDGAAPYALMVFAGMLPWTFFSTALSAGTNSLVGSAHLITKVYFPREILPLTYVFAALFDFGIGLVVLGGLMAWYHVPISAQLVNLIPIVGLLAAWILAVALVLSAAQVRWRDVGVAMPLVVQLWMFASPVIYPLSVVPEAWRHYYLLNPMAGIIASFRDILLQRTQPDPEPLRYALVVTAIALPLAYVIFKRAEATMADLV